MKVLHLLFILYHFLSIDNITVASKNFEELSHFPSSISGKHYP